MTEEREQLKQIGNRVVGTVVDVKGHCSWGHKAGDRFELSTHDTAGVCGFLYHDLFPYINMLQFGGGFPAEWGNPDVVEVQCMDLGNAVKVKLERAR